MSKKSNPAIVKRETTKEVPGPYTTDHPRYHELVENLINAQIAMAPVNKEIESRKAILKTLEKTEADAIHELSFGNIQTIDIIQTVNFETKKVTENRKDNGELLLERDMDETDAQGRTGDEPATTEDA